MKKHTEEIADQPAESQNCINKRNMLLVMIASGLRWKGKWYFIA
jgi:hypothetical protein